VKILFHHPHPLPVSEYGGIERILWWHMKRLVVEGHQVVLIGNPNTNVESTGIELIAYPHDDLNWQHLIPQGIDLIHLFYNYDPKVNIPVVNTIQGNGVQGEFFHLNTVFVSSKHAQNHGSGSYIYNGIDFTEYPYIPKKKKWNDFLFLAKASWSVKNLKGCVKACRSSHKNLHIAGGKYFWPSRFINNYGMVGGQKKLEIINHCDALLFPVRWHEPFGIAIIEAMACGLPVAGSPYGSLPELINPSVGKIVKNQSELTEFVHQDRQYDSEAIRNYAQKKFNIIGHTLDYLKIYQKVINGQSLNAKNPSWVFEQKAVTLLEF
jgi:glycosyltransferase involved in cell wall biosynthesis